MITDDTIKELFFVGNSKRFTRKYNSLIENKEIVNYLLNRYNDSKTLKETIYRIFYNIEERPTCKICGKQVVFNAGSNVFKDKIFSNCCCKECENKYRHINKVNAIKNKYGVNNVAVLDFIKEKIKNTTYSHYGYTCSLSCPEIREKGAVTNLQKYGVTNGGGSYVALEKIKYHFNTYYGVDNPSQIDWVKEKIKNTTYSHYGAYCALHTPEIIEISKQTCYEKYGAYYFSQTSYFINKINKTSLSKYNTYFPSQYNVFKNKVKQTCYEKYGYTCYLSTPEMQKKSHSYEVIQKQLNTKLKNYTFNKSKQEDECYKLLINKFNNVIRQYKSDVYPYNCDFYIPEIDTYIEFNGSQYHHGHAFNKNSTDDNIELQRLINNDINSDRAKHGKESQWHKIIYVWTELDVKKRNIAKQNNLNFIEFWDIKKVKDWINFTTDNMFNKWFGKNSDDRKELMDV